MLNIIQLLNKETGEVAYFTTDNYNDIRHGMYAVFWNYDKAVLSVRHLSKRQMKKEIVKKVDDKSWLVVNRHPETGSWQGRLYTEDSEGYVDYPIDLDRWGYGRLKKKNPIGHFWGLNP